MCAQYQTGLSNTVNVECFARLGFGPFSIHVVNPLLEEGLVFQLLDNDALAIAFFNGHWVSRDAGCRHL